MKNQDITPLMTALCEALDQNELEAFNEDSKLLTLVNRLLELQAPFNSGPDAVRQTANLVSWFEHNGGFCKKAKLFEQSTNNFGMQCSENVAEAEAVVKIPQNILLTADCANCPELYIVCQADSTLSHMPNLRLTLNLLNERLNPSSKWKDYLAALPISYSGLMYFTSEHFQHLRPSPAFSTCARLYCKLLGSYVYLYSKFFGKDEDESEPKPPMGPSIHFTPENFTFAAFRWAISTVMTRQNNVPIGGGLALVPVLDMLNHDPSLRASVDFDADNSSAGGHVVVYASKAFSKGDELKIFYGQRPNHDLFVHNGFALMDNPYDSYYAYFPFKMVESECENRRKLIQRLGIERDCFKLTLEHPLPKSLLACVHVDYAPDDLVEKWLGRSIADVMDELVAEKPAVLGSDLYRKAYVWLAAQLGLKLRSYKNAENAVQSNDSITQQISTLLSCEKRILEAVVAKLQLLLQK